MSEARRGFGLADHLRWIAGNFLLRLIDAAGDTSFHVRNSDDADVFTLDSLGRIGGTRAVGCRVRRSTDQTIATAGGWVSVIFDTEVEDTDGCWASGDPTKLYVRRAGWYIAGANVPWKDSVSQAGSYRAARILLGLGTVVARVIDDPMGSANNKYMNLCSAMFEMAVDSYVRLQVLHNVGSDHYLVGDSAEPNAWLVRIP